MLCFRPLTFMAIVAATLVFLLTIYASSEQSQGHVLGRYTRRAYEDVEDDGDENWDGSEDFQDNGEKKKTTSMRPTRTPTTIKPSKSTKPPSSVRPKPTKSSSPRPPKSTPRGRITSSRKPDISVRPHKSTLAPKPSKTSTTRGHWVPKPDEQVKDEICIISHGKLIKIDGLGQLKSRPICHPGKCHAKSKELCPYFKKYT